MLWNHNILTTTDPDKLQKACSVLLHWKAKVFCLRGERNNNRGTAI